MPPLTTLLKCGAVLVAGVLWTFGLIDQLDSFDMTARYVAVSAAMIAVATL
jgi:glucose uptake protein GlcU